MKTQITTIAAAIAVALSMGVSADARDPNYEHNGSNFNGGKGDFDDQATIRNNMNGFNGTSNARESVIYQNGGSNNVANATQQGTEQFSRIKQTHNGTSNEAYVTQGQNGGHDESNESEVLQIGGTDNYARVNQTGNYNDSYIKQTGAGNNIAEVDQLNNSDYSDSVIFQDGDGNEAYVTQKNNTQTTWSHISQDGNDHYAKVTQDTANNSASYIFQTGTSYEHSATVEQRDTTDSLSMIRQATSYGAAAIANHTQVNGTGNYASSVQW